MKTKEFQLQKRTAAHFSPTQALSVSSRRFVPPLLLETHPSLIHAGAAFALHVLALCALIGATAKTLHFLTNLILSAALGVGLLPWLVAITMTCIAVAFALALAVAIVRSALKAQQDAFKKLNIEWLSDNSIQISATAGTTLPPELAKHQSQDRSSSGKNGTDNPASVTQPILHCVPVSGCYSSHLWVTLALDVRKPRRQANDSTAKFLRCYLVLARDSLDDRAYRHLRLWLRVALNRGSEITNYKTNN